MASPRDLIYPLPRLAPRVPAVSYTPAAELQLLLLHRFHGILAVPRRTRLAPVVTIGVFRR